MLDFTRIIKYILIKMLTNNKVCN